MASFATRTIFACAIPSVIVVLSYFWYQRRKRIQDSKPKNHSNLKDYIYNCPDSSIEEESGGEPALKMHLKEFECQSETNLSSEKLQLTNKIKSGSSHEKIDFANREISPKIVTKVSCNNTSMPDKSEKTVTCSAPEKINGATSELVDSMSKLQVEEQSNDTDSKESLPSLNQPLSASESEQIVSVSESDQSVSSSKDKANEELQLLPPVEAENKLINRTCENSENEEKSCTVVEKENQLNVQLENNVHLNQSLDMMHMKVPEQSKPRDQNSPVLENSYDSATHSLADENMDSPPHSTYSDVHSEGSSDSGKGGSDIQPSSECSNLSTVEDGITVYKFELPHELCGRLIGKLRQNLAYMKEQSNANVLIKRHPFNPHLKLCLVEGSSSEIKIALELIRRKFPLSHYPAVTLDPFNASVSCGVPVPETLQLHLPEGIMCETILSSMVTAGHFFLQQPTHPTYPSLSRLDQCMLTCYTHMDTPQLPQPLDAGIICAAPIMNGWFRGQVVTVHENQEECDVKFVDYGGYSVLPISSLRQIRSDFMTLPFQAAECYLANVKPYDEEQGWSLEACSFFEELAQGQILQTLIVGYAEDGIPFVHLYRVRGVSTYFVNRELVNNNMAHWVEY